MSIDRYRASCRYLLGDPQHGLRAGAEGLHDGALPTYLSKLAYYENVDSFKIDRMSHGIAFEYHSAPHVAPDECISDAGGRDADGLCELLLRLLHSLCFCLALAQHVVPEIGVMYLV